MTEEAAPVTIHDPVVEALAAALERASAAGEWDVVADLARELQVRRDEARRQAEGQANVVRLPVKREASS